MWMWMGDECDSIESDAHTGLIFPFLRSLSTKVGHYPTTTKVSIFYHDTRLSYLPQPHLQLMGSLFPMWSSITQRLLERSTQRRNEAMSIVQFSCQ